MSYALNSVGFRLGFSNLWKFAVFGGVHFPTFYLFVKSLFWKYRFVLLTYKIVRSRALTYIYFYYYKYIVVKPFKVYRRTWWQRRANVRPLKLRPMWKIPKVLFFGVQEKCPTWLFYPLRLLKIRSLPQKRRSTVDSRREVRKRRRRYPKSLFLKKHYRAIKKKILKIEKKKMRPRMIIKYLINLFMLTKKLYRRLHKAKFSQRWLRKYPIKKVQKMYFLWRVLLVKISRWTKLGDLSIESDPIKRKLKIIMARITKHTMLWRNIRLRRSSLEKHLFRRCIGPYVGIRTTYTFPSQFLYRQGKGHAEELQRLAKLSIFYKKQMQFARVKRFWVASRVKFWLNWRLKKKNKRFYINFMSRRRRGRKFLVWSFKKAALLKTIFLRLLGPVEWRSLCARLGLYRALTKKLSRRSVTLKAIKTLFYRRYLKSEIKKKMLRIKIDLRRARNKHLSWKSAAYARKKYIRFFKIKHQIVFKKPTFVRDNEKKAYSGQNYRHFETQRRESLYAGKFFWCLVDGGQKYGGMQKFRLRMTRKVSGNVSANVIKKIAGVSKQVSGAAYMPRKERRRLFNRQKRLNIRRKKFWNPEQNEKFNFNNAGNQRPKYFSSAKLSREAMVTIMVRQKMSGQNWNFRGAGWGRSLPNNNSFSRVSNRRRAVRRDNWSRNAKGRGHSRSFSTAPKWTKAFSHSLTPKLKYFVGTKKKQGKNSSKKILKKKIVLMPNSKKFAESLRSLISRRNKERRVWVRRYPLSKLMMKSLRMTYFKGKFLNTRVFSVKMSRYLAFSVLQTMLKKRKLHIILRKKKAFLRAVQKQSVCNLEFTAKIRKVSYRRKIRKVSLAGRKILKKETGRSVTIPELQIVARYSKHRGRKKITKQKLSGKLKAATQRKVVKTLSLSRLLKKFKKICRRKKLKLRLKNKKKIKKKKLLKKAKFKLLSGAKKIPKRRSRRTLLAIQKKFTNLLRKKKLLCSKRRVKRGSGVSFSNAAFVVAQVRWLKLLRFYELSKRKAFRVNPIDQLKKKLYRGTVKNAVLQKYFNLLFRPPKVKKLTPREVYLKQQDRWNYEMYLYWLRVRRSTGDRNIVFERENKSTVNLLPKPTVGRRKKKKLVVKKLRGAKKKNYLRRFIHGRKLAEIARVHYRINFFKFKKRLRRKKRKRNFLYYDSFSRARALYTQKMRCTPALFDIVLKKNCLHMLKREGFFLKKYAIARDEDSEEFEFCDARFAAWRRFSLVRGWKPRKYFRHLFEFLPSPAAKAVPPLVAAATVISYMLGETFPGCRLKFRDLEDFNSYILDSAREMKSVYWFFRQKVTVFFYMTLIVAKLLNSAYFLNFALHKMFLNVYLHYFVLRNFLMIWKTFLFWRCGLRLVIAGKWFGKMRAKKKVLLFANAVRQTISKYVDYHNSNVITKYGIFSLKSWVMNLES